MIDKAFFSRQLSSFNPEEHDNSLKFCLSNDSDYDFYLDFSQSDQLSLTAKLRNMTDSIDNWYMIFRPEDYRQTDLFNSHVINTTSSLAGKNSCITIKKGLFFIQFQCSIASENGESSVLHNYGKLRFFCSPPPFSGRTADFTGSPG